jgi:hypothetical protein
MKSRESSIGVIVVSNKYVQYMIKPNGHCNLLLIRTIIVLLLDAPSTIGLLR